MNKGVEVNDQFTSDDILKLISLEKTNKEIAEELKISKKYVEYLIKNLFLQFGVKSRVGLVREYMKEIKPNC